MGIDVINQVLTENTKKQVKIYEPVIYPATNQAKYITLLPNSEQNTLIYQKLFQSQESNLHLQFELRHH